MWLHTQPPLSFGHLPLSEEESYRANDESCRSLLGELSSVARLRGFNIQPVIASNSEAIQDDIYTFLFWFLSGSPRSFHSLAMTGYTWLWPKEIATYFLIDFSHSWAAVSNLFSQGMYSSSGFWRYCWSV